MNPQSPYLLLSGPRPGTNSSQTRVTAWLHLGNSKPIQGTAISSCFVVHAGWSWEEHRWELTLACTIQLTPGSVYPMDSHRPLGAPPFFSCKLILHGGWRMVVSSHSQSLQLTGLSKYLPLTCQQQSSINYKRMMYSSHMSMDMSTQIR